MKESPAEMKNIMLIGISIAIAMGFTACQKDNLSEKNSLLKKGESGLVTETFFVEFGSTGTKTTSSDYGKNIQWAAGDKIYYYTANGGDVRTCTIDKAGDTATLALERRAIDTFYNLVYAGGTEPKFSRKTADEIAFECPANQDGTFGSAHIGYAKSFPEGSSITFKPANAIVRFTTDRTDIKKIELTGGADGDYVAGTIHVYPDGGMAPSVEGSSDCVTATIDTPAAGTYYLGVLPVILENGLKLTLKNENDMVIGVVTAPDQINLEDSSSMINLGEIDSHIALYVAAIGNTSYPDLKTAFAAADKSTAPVTIDLLTDITTDETDISITNNTEGVSLNLNGKNITFNGSDISGKNLFYVNGGKLIVIDDTETPGTITATEGNSFYLFGVYSGSLVINNGHFTISETNSGKVIYAEGGKIEISGGKFESSSSEVEMFGFYASTESVAIAEGEFIKTADMPIIKSDINTKLYIISGYFYKTDGAYVPFDIKSLMTVQGGYYNNVNDLNPFVATGFELTQLGSPVKYDGKEYYYRVVQPEGALAGLFSVSATKQVFFSKGNLQYQATTSSWRFASNQYDCMGMGNQDISSTYSGWIDLFGWAATGQKSINDNLPYPYDMSQDDKLYKTVATPSEDETLTRANGGDWGVCMGEGWRTPSIDEWEYLLIKRPDAASKTGYATVGGMTGLIILPDIFVDPMKNNGSGTFVPQSSTGYGQNIYTSGKNWDAMESVGALFLPAAGYRAAWQVRVLNYYGNYWTSTAKDKDNAYDIYFCFEGITPRFEDKRHAGFSVRLIFD